MLKDDDGDDDEEFPMSSNRIAYMAISAARRSGLALLLGFWLALVVWAPSNGDLLVLQNRNLNTAVDDQDLRGAAAPASAGDLLQRSNAVKSEDIRLDPDVVHLRRRALVPADRDDPPERQRVEDWTVAVHQQYQRKDDHRDDSVRASTHREHNDARRIRDFLKEQISTAKILIRQQQTQHEAFERRGDVKQLTTEQPLAEKSDQENGITDILDEVFISVKTTKTNHRTRLPPILQTWFQLARNQTYFFSDTADDEIARASGGHLVITGCPAGHSRRALSCKMNSEFDAFANSDRNKKKWWCHLDDDNYLNVPALGKLLSRYDSSRVWYLGRNSIMKPIDLNTKDWGRVRFRFATGGAGFCISRALADALEPHAFAGRLAQLSDRIRLPDDVTVGFLIEVIVGAKLTVVPEFHSHLEEMRLLKGPLKNQISLSYMKKRSNFVALQQHLPNDPTSFISVHCVLFPLEPLCTRLRSNKNHPN